MRRVAGVVAVYVFLCAFVAFAQTDRGTITGTVLDVSGAVIPTASIEAKNAATGEVYTAGTTGTGNYTLANLPAGTYEFTVTAAGFKKFIRSTLTVQVAETTRADATLEGGAATESTTVSTEAAQLKTESGEVSHQLNYSDENNIPVFSLNGSGTEGIG